MKTQSSKPTFWTETSPEQQMLYIKLMANDLLWMVFTEALRALFLANDIDQASEKWSQISQEIAKAMSILDYRKQKRVEYAPFDAISKKYNFSLGSAYAFFHAVDHAMNSARNLHWGIEKINTDWFNAVEAEWWQILSNADKIMNIIGKEGNPWASHKEK